jgi:hypothetical protein
VCVRCCCCGAHTSTLPRLLPRLAAKTALRLHHSPTLATRSFSSLSSTANVRRDSDHLSAGLAFLAGPRRHDAEHSHKVVPVRSHISRATLR